MEEKHRKRKCEPYGKKACFCSLPSPCLSVKSLRLVCTLALTRLFFFLSLTHTNTKSYAQKSIRQPRNTQLIKMYVGISAVDIIISVASAFILSCFVSHIVHLSHRKTHRICLPFSCLLSWSFCAHFYISFFICTLTSIHSFIHSYVYIKLLARQKSRNLIICKFGSLHDTTRNERVE